MSPAETLISVLKRRTQSHPDRRAFAYLRDGEVVSATLTFGELESAARATAARLSEVGQPGDRAILLYPQGLDFIVAFLACQWAGLVPVPVSQPNRQRGYDALGLLAVDAGARCILTTAALAGQHADGVGGRPELAVLPLVRTDEWREAAGGAPWPDREPRADDLALLQYTSGSTGTPRGVIVSHANLSDNQRQVEQAFSHDDRTIILSWLPMFHDMGLGTVLQALWLGVPCTLMSPSAFLQKPVRWLRAISVHRATTSGGPDFAYDLCARRVEEEDRAGLDLRSWRVAYSGAEPVRAASLDRFHDAFAGAGFRREAFHPVYGMAESTLFITAPPAADPPFVLRVDAEALSRDDAQPAGDGVPVVSCGGPWPGTQLRIVDPQRREPVADGRVGEIWVRGASVAGGYWRRPDETLATFGAVLPGDEAPFLRTGDLGFLHDGRLFITGRLKDLIIIRGRNHYPQDIEATAGASHAALEPAGAAAFSVDVEDAEQLVVVQEVKRSALKHLDTGDAIRAIRAAVAERHGLNTHAVVLIRPATLPRTSSGKTRRRACREAYLSSQLEDVASWVFWSEPAEAEDAREAAVPGRRDDQVEAILEWIRTWAAGRINSRTIDERRTIPPSVVLDLGNRGLLGLQAPKESGGLGFGHLATSRVLEQLAAVDLTVCLFVGLNNYLGLRPLLRFAPEDLRARLVPAVAAGRQLAAFALTEPAAGSNPRAIETRATADGAGRWRLHGTKIWSGAAQWAGVIHVFARHEAGDAAGAISAFAVPQGAPGLTQGPEAITMGMRGLVQNTVRLDGVGVDDACLLGGVGRGMDVAHDAMMHARLAIAAASLGAMRRCAQLGIRYASRRTINTGRLLDHPVTLARLAETTSAIAALEALVTAVATTLDAGADVPPEALAACKCLGPELLWDTVDGLAQLLGGRGYIETNLVPQLMRDARVLRIFEGPTETMAAFLGARAMSSGEALHGFLSNALGAPGVSEELRQAMDRTAPAPHEIHWQHALAGEVAANAVLLAAIDGAARRAPDDSRLHAVAWARRRFTASVTRLRDTPAPSLQPGDAQAIIAAYARQIGDVEQSLAPEDWTLDPFLRRDGDVSARAMPVAAPARDQGEAARIRAWLAEWLGRRLRIAPGDMDGGRAFADHGLDSVASVELVHDLSTWLGRALDETLLWNYGTPDALIAHLAGGLAPPPVPPAGAGESGPVPSLEDELTRLERLLGERR